MSHEKLKKLSEIRCRIAPFSEYCVILDHPVGHTLGEGLVCMPRAPIFVKANNERTKGKNVLLLLLLSSSAPFVLNGDNTQSLAPVPSAPACYVNRVAKQDQL